MAFSPDQNVALGQQPFGQITLQVLPKLFTDAVQGLTRFVLVVEVLEHGSLHGFLQGHGKGLAMVLRQPGHCARAHALMRLCGGRRRRYGLAAAVLVFIAAAAGAGVVASDFLVHGVVLQDGVEISNDKKSTSRLSCATRSCGTSRYFQSFFPPRNRSQNDLSPGLRCHSKFLADQEV